MISLATWTWFNALTSGGCSGSAFSEVYFWSATRTSISKLERLEEGDIVQRLQLEKAYAEHWHEEESFTKSDTRVVKFKRVNKKVFTEIVLLKSWFVTFYPFVLSSNVSMNCCFCSLFLISIIHKLVCLSIIHPAVSVYIVSYASDVIYNFMTAFTRLFIGTFSCHFNIFGKEANTSNKNNIYNAVGVQIIFFFFFFNQNVWKFINEKKTVLLDLVIQLWFMF